MVTRVSVGTRGVSPFSSANTTKEVMQGVCEAAKSQNFVYEAAKATSPNRL